MPKNQNWRWLTALFKLLRHFDITIANPYKPWSSICYGIFFQKDFNVYLSRATYD